ncbi:hypothetical protein AVEN_165647-1 [Araneus ventricosus]|uniref:Uncharacterized protein n=1 Tax=Araneus ventricosus TaxID=182803 RepID=A0A4Y2AIZ3_ARAVE|nr:hypothetical protein AVEN_165647-1 [Araneus ventricosus]
MWATCRVPVDGAAIATDVRVSSCREQWKRTKRYETLKRRGLSFLTKAREDDVPSKSLSNDDFLQLYISLTVNNASSKYKFNPDNITI